jgi:hexokinase
LLEKITADVTARLAEVMIEKFTSDSKDNPLLEIIYAKLHGEILPQVVETVDSQVAALQTEIHSIISINFKEETDLVFASVTSLLTRSEPSFLLVAKS